MKVKNSEWKDFIVWYQLCLIEKTRCHMTDELLSRMLGISTDLFYKWKRGSRPGKKYKTAIMSRMTEDDFFTWLREVKKERPEILERNA